MAPNQFDHNHNSGFASTLQHVYHDLQTNHADATSEIPFSHDSYDFLGVRHSLKSNLDISHFRSSLASSLKLNVQDDFRLVQVVGDSGLGFDSSAVEKVLSIIRGCISDTTGSTATNTTVLEYGYTAGKYDTNWIVNELLERDHWLAERTVGNIVYESARAVEEWGCEATGNVRSFVLVYDETGQTRFGDDLFVSDGIMRGREDGNGDGDGDGDVMICIEGGVQSLEQVCGVLSNGVKVLAVTGRLRREEEDGASASRFSAARLIKDCVDMLSNGRETESIETELMDELRKSGCFDKRPEMDKRVEGSLSWLLMGKDKLKHVEIVLVD